MRDEAIQVLRDWIVNVKAPQLVDFGWSYRTVPWDTAYLDMMLNGKTEQYVEVSTLNCDTAVLGVEGNQMLRFWHDVTHIDQGLTFDYEDEILVNKLMLRQIRHLPRLCQQILWADMTGQVEYHKQWGTFPVNQAGFVDSCLQHGINTAILVKH